MKSLALLTMMGLASAETISVWVQDRRVVREELHTLDAGATAVAEFADTLNQTGWGILDVNTRPSKGWSDADQAYGAGYAEGRLTAPRIWEHFQNMYQSHYGDLTKEEITKVNDWLVEQYTWTKTQAKMNEGDVFWDQVANVMHQFDGLVDGYANTSMSALNQADFLMLNGDGDLFQIVPAVVPRKVYQFDTMTNDEAEDTLAKMGKCSSIIKTTGDFSDLFMGHSSWYTYSATNRIFKHYQMGYEADVPGKKVSFSSYPGYLESLDDFYMMSSGLGMVQTSINFANSSFYSYVKPQSLLAWQRVRTAHVVASTGEEWHAAVSRSHSGTYCNQYMIVNYNLFEAGKPLKPGTLWVMEEIPGQLPGADLTDVLSYGYWPSYNVPYFPQIYAQSGLPELALRGVPSASYQTAPRAKVFRRDADKVTSLGTYEDILRYNAYKTDPYSGGSPCGQICCRGDLGEKGSPFGCYDTKVTNSSLFKTMSARIVNGPTHGGKDDLPVYSWSAFESQSHVGLPPVYNFSWVHVTPKTL
eukprot:TRINITY_DN430_c1_g3_i1.p1 TRINITY_DN430_c1_g3~~TRINITY_DN430_c1_g3_i1.p1  ORF type:complete len:553 (+),score=98.41 TRINITY_DN430_c1_g3_i1:75-1661(+)